MMSTKKYVSDELLASFIDGNTTPEQNTIILDMLKESPSGFEEFRISMMASNLSDFEEQVNNSINILTNAHPYASWLLFSTPFQNVQSSLIPNVAASTIEENKKFFLQNDRFNAIQNSIHEINNINNFNMERNVIGQDNLVQQLYNDTCAIKSQQLILQEFGVHATEDQLVQWSIDNGLYTGNGTAFPDIGKILTFAGIPCEQKMGANMFDITNELAQGHKVIVGVDSGELWHRGIKEWWEDVWHGESADHALIVAGIDNTDPQNLMVLLTDPGSGDLCKSYPLSQFMDAWQDSGFRMISTNVSPSEFVSTQISNCQPTMYIADIGNHSYQDFQLFHDLALALPTHYDWNFDLYPQHPISSLYQAYTTNLNMAEMNLSNYDFFHYVDGNAFTTNFENTLDFNIDHLADPMAISAFNSFIDSALGIDVTSLHGYLVSQANHYIEIGDLNTANFFNQQTVFLDYCEAFGLNPVDFYQHYDFTNALSQSHDFGTGIF